MNKTILKLHSIYLLMIVLVFMPNLVLAQEQKIRVVAAHANIRMKPEFGSDIIDTAPRGGEFEVKDKTGEWYQVGFESRVGIRIFGYIYEKEVEEIRREEKVLEVPAKAPEVFISQPVLEKEPWSPRIELVLSGGYNTGYSITQSVEYAFRFSEGALKQADEHGMFTQNINKPIAFGGALNYFFDRNFGLQLRFDLNTKADIKGVSNYNLTWEWLQETGGFINENWDITDNVTLMSLGANIILKPQIPGMIAPVLSGGVSYFIGNLSLNSMTGFALTWDYEQSQYIDYWIFPSKIDASLNGIGFNAGGGVELPITPDVGFHIDARYFMKSKIEEQWKTIPGNYNSEFHNAIFSLSQEGFDSVLDLQHFEINPSFFKFSLGLLFAF